jgi:ABC-type branched-subunit amino acid transport system substrate-binding protein
VRHRRGSKIIVAGIAALTLATAASIGSPVAGAANEKPAATEIGVSADTIHIGVIADVVNPLAPGLFQGAVDGVEAWGKYINQHGGLAGRKVQVDFLDSKLSNSAARDAMIQACEQDFAIVGSAALGLATFDPLVNCKDKAGAVTGLPDIPTVQTGLAYQCSPVSYNINGTALDCATKDQHPQTYREGVGQTRYLKTSLKLTKGSWLFTNDLKSVLETTIPSTVGERTVGLKGDNEIVTARSPQSDYTPWVQKLKSDGVEYVENFGAAHNMAEARKEAAVQGVTSVKAWTCTTVCYDAGYLTDAGAAAEGTYVWTPEVPREETAQNKAVATMVKAVGKDKIVGFSELAWESALLFRDAVTALVKTKGVNGLTRANLLESLKGIHTWNADGIRGQSDPGNHIGTACFALLQVKNNKFVRVFPKKKGTLDCNAKNVAVVKYDNQSS